MPTENFFLHREYLWGDGGEGPDELLAYVGTTRSNIFYPIQDGSGDVIAIADMTSDGAAGTPNALRPRILEQRVYAPYGEVVDFWQSPEVLNGTVALPPLAAGHKGLFFERLDAGALTWAGDGYVETHPHAPLATNTGATQHPYLIGHARNRTLHTVLGQWNQRDPNATGMVVVAFPAMHGVALMAVPSDVQLTEHLRDGNNVSAYVQGSPLLLGDSMGLFSLGELGGSMSIGASVSGEYNQEVLQTGGGISMWIANHIGSYAFDQFLDLQWAGDWSQPDDLYRGSASWAMNSGSWQQYLDEAAGNGHARAGGASPSLLDGIPFKDNERGPGVYIIKNADGTSSVQVALAGT